MDHEQPMVVASAPGKCVLFGEHAVVYGEPALAVAIEQRLTAKFYPSKVWSIDGSGLTHTKHPHVAFLAQRILGEAWETTPYQIQVSADIPRASGLGSSAALSVAVAGALMAIRNQGADGIDKALIAQFAHEAEAYAQGGRASPMDTSTSTFGGAILLSNQHEEHAQWLLDRSLVTDEATVTWHIHSTHIPTSRLSLVIGNSGIHSPTKRQVEHVAALIKSNPQRYQEISAIGAVTRRGMAAFQAGDFTRMGHAMSENHLLLRQLGVSSDELEGLVTAAIPSSLGAKLTGAGGGGCMVALTQQAKQTGEAIELAGGRCMVSSIGNPGVEITFFSPKNENL